MTKTPRLDKRDRMLLKKCHYCFKEFQGRAGKFCSSSCSQTFRWKTHIPKPKDVEKNKFRRLVSNTVARAKQSGVLVMASVCEVCKTSPAEQAHHEDYTKLLDVQWLCSPCHRARHVELKRLGIQLPGVPNFS